jgi:hypothetical protein
LNPRSPAKGSAVFKCVGAYTNWYWPVTPGTGKCLANEILVPAVAQAYQHVARGAFAVPFAPVSSQRRGHRVYFAAHLHEAGPKRLPKLNFGVLERARRSERAG